jgi:hypothetical protein
LIHHRNDLANPLDERLDCLALDLPCRLVVTDLEPRRECAGQSDDHEDETHGQQSNRPGLEVGDEDGEGSYA